MEFWYVRVELYRQSLFETGRILADANDSSFHCSCFSCHHGGFFAFPLFAPYREAFEQFIFSTLLPEQYSDQILGYIKQFATQAAGLTAFGLIGLMVSALL